MRHRIKFEVTVEVAPGAHKGDAWVGDVLVPKVRDQLAACVEDAVLRAGGNVYYSTASAKLTEHYTARAKQPPALASLDAVNDWEEET